MLACMRNRTERNRTIARLPPGAIGGEFSLESLHSVVCFKFICLQDRADLARYAHLPLGAIGGDWRTATADALFGRALRDAG